MDKRHILAEIVRTAKENGGVAMGRQKFFEATGIRESDWSGKYWTRWNDAVREAGCEPNQMQEAFPDELLLENFAALIRELGHIPTSPELRMKARSSATFPSHNTFRRLGNKQERIARTHAYCVSREDLLDIAAICEPYLVSSQVDETRESDDKSGWGYVYLIRAGHYYKIGRTNSIVRRERELAIQLPERAETLHTIATDDPVGVESYWHRRYAGKRKNGEWFELSAAEVKAFCRRKFM